MLWTPSGYYDASPGGEELVGWHVNNGTNAAADFFPSSRFRSTFYRPDVVSRVLATLDEGEALRLASEEKTRLAGAAGGAGTKDAEPHQLLPPVVTLLSPADGAETASAEITVRYRVQSPSGEPLTGLRVLVDGRPVKPSRNLSPVSAGAVGETSIRIPEQNCEVSVVAENRFSASEPAMLRLRWKGASAFVIKPKLYLLAVGISQYPAPYQLALPAKDARDFTNVLVSQKGRLYRDVEFKLLADQQAGKEQILDGLEWLEKSATQHDIAMVFLAGHGVNDSNGVYYYLPAGFDPDRLKSTAVVFSDIKNTVNVVAGKVLLFVDTCHSGNVFKNPTRALPADINGLINELSSAENGAIVFAASTGRQVALEDASWGNGAFTKALIEGLSGKADIQGTGRVTVNMLDLYISERVKELTNGRQTPATTKPHTIADFPVAVP